MPGIKHIRDLTSEEALFTETGARGAAEELREREERFRLASRATNDVVWDWNLVTNEGWRNDTFQTRFGYAAGRLKTATETWYGGIHPQDKDRVIAALRAAIDSDRETWSEEYRFFRADKSLAYIFDRGYIVRNDQKKAVRMIGVMMDVSVRKTAEEKLRRQASMVEGAQDAICESDLAHQILFWNKGAERLYGHSAFEAVGKNAHDLLLLPEQAFDQKTAHQRVIEYGDWSGELYHVTKEGRALVVESRWTLLRNEKGEPDSILIFNIDQTKKKEANLQELRAQRLQSIGALTGGIAHDLNNALTPISIGISLLREEPISPSGIKMLDLMRNSLQHSTDMVKQILSFSRGVGGEQTIIEVKDLVAEMVKMIQETFPRCIKVCPEIAADLHPVMGNSTQIHQVLLNLCVNARDAMAKGGSLTITTENILLGPGSLPEGQGLNPGAYVLLKIQDTGSGIPPELLQKIFEPFFTTKIKDNGTGLGLSTVMGIVKTHGGFLEVQSEVGRGTTFEVYLPATGAMQNPRKDGGG